MTLADDRALDAALDRIEGRDKVTGAAKYAYEYGHDDVCYASVVQATIARAEIRSVDATEPHDVELAGDHPGIYAPPVINPAFATDTEQGDVDAAFAAVEVLVDHTYETVAVHNNPMEPHATLAVWDAGAVTIYDSTQ